MLDVVSVFGVVSHVITNTVDRIVDRHSLADRNAHCGQELVDLALRCDVDPFARSHAMRGETQGRQPPLRQCVVALQPLDPSTRAASGRVACSRQLLDSLVHPLADRPRCGIPRIGERRSSGGHLLVVHYVEIHGGQEHFAAYLEQRWWPLAGEFLGDRSDELGVVCDVLTRHAIAARCHRGQTPLSIDEVDGQSVDLDLA